MRYFYGSLWVIAVFAYGLVACTDPNPTQHEDAAEQPADITEQPADLAADLIETAPMRASSDCDPTLRPILFVHGFMGSGDTFAKHAQRFSSNGHCHDRIYAFDWDTFDQNLDNVSLLDTFVDQILTETKEERLDLAGHSAGGGLGYDYLMDPARSKKVAHYAHIGSFEYDQPAGESGSVPTLNLTSEGDTVVVTSGEIPGATNVRLKDEDHYAVATSAASFDAIYRYFRDDAAPATTDILGELEITVAGKVVSFGQNSPMVGAQVEIYEVDPENGAHLTPVPQATAVSDENGQWGPITVARDRYYDFKAISPKENEVTPHYYKNPFPRSDHLVYLRTLPTGISLIGLMLSTLPFDQEEAVLIIFSNQRALVSGRDSLKINGDELLTEQLTPTGETILALFLYDENGDAVGDGHTVEAFKDIPFLAAVDSFFPLDNGQPIQIEFNGDAFAVPALSSKSEGPVVVILD